MAERGTMPMSRRAGVAKALVELAYSLWPPPDKLEVYWKASNLAKRAEELGLELGPIEKALSDLGLAVRKGDLAGAMRAMGPLGEAMDKALGARLGRELTGLFRGLASTALAVRRRSWLGLAEAMMDLGGGLRALKGTRCWDKVVQAYARLGMRGLSQEFDLCELALKDLARTVDEALGGLL